MSHGIRRSEGFTLVEVMIATSLLAIGLLALAAMQLLALDYGSRGRHMTQASAVAETRVELLARRRWTDLAPTAGWTAPINVAHTVQGATNHNEQVYRVSWRIADVEPGRTRSIDVQVAWDDPNWPNRSYALSTMRFNHEGL
jgi:prepilin-type N-terminal cleavage/methylation domain-containing protein